MGSARDKLNFMYLLFCLGVGGFVGTLFDSSAFGVVATIVMIAISVNERFLR
jgi:hypothetical protein